MKLIRWFLLASALTACLLATATAAEFDGYIVQIEKPVRLLSASEEPDLPDMTKIHAKGGVYRVEDEQALDELRAQGLLISAEPNYIVTLDDLPTPEKRNSNSRPFGFSDVTADLPPNAVLLDASNSENQWYASALEMDWVSEQGVKGKGVRVGVVDSGIFKGHQDFKGVKVLDGANYVTGGDPKDVSDGVGHGTFVSGLIAAAENGVGIAGLAPEVELVPLKCFDSKTGSIANIAAAIYAAVDTWHCQVLNLSLGIEKESEVLKKAIEYADNAGVIMVAAAGNLLSGEHDPNGDPLNYPAAYPQVVGVGAVDSALSAASFSYRNKSVDIAAPGRNLRGPLHTDAKKYSTGYGTSYAAPMVTAAAALALSANPKLTSAQVRDMLTNTVRDAGEPGYDTTYGYGLLHIGRLVAAAKGNLLHQAEVVREQIADTKAPTPGLFAAAYGADGAFLGLRDVSPTVALDREPNATPVLWEADSAALSEETFKLPGAASWKLFPFDRFTFSPGGTSQKLYG